jgi:hypothetical protein
MSSDSPTIARYTSGAYAAQHPDWHLGDARGKAEDLLPGLLAVVERIAAGTFRLADVGAGVGAVLAEVVKRLREKCPQLPIDATAMEVSPQAADSARRLNPELNVVCKLLEPTDGPFTAIMLVDVLEHLENPWEMLRTAAHASRFLVVRQPLLEGFSMFRHNRYRPEREKWGHIGYFNERSFLDMAEATGWKPLHVELIAPWELKTSQAKRVSPIKRLLIRANRPISSHFMSGFYLNGSFERTDETGHANTPS